MGAGIDVAYDSDSDTEGIIGDGLHANEMIGLTPDQRVLRGGEDDFHAERSVYEAAEARKAVAARVAAANAERDMAAAWDTAAAAAGAARAKAAEVRASFPCTVQRNRFLEHSGKLRVSRRFRGLLTSAPRRRPFARLKNPRVGR